MADQKAVVFLQEEQFDAFNQYVEQQGGAVDLSSAHLRSFDLRKCHLEKANLTGAYMRACDIRAMDLSEAQMDQASFKDAKISGVLFPRNVSSFEITMSVQYGTRIRQGM